MFFLLVIVLFQSDPSLPPDSVSKSFPTLQGCKDAAYQSSAMLQKGHSVYGAVAMSCQAASDPRLLRKAGP